MDKEIPPTFNDVEKFWAKHLIEEDNFCTTAEMQAQSLLCKLSATAVHAATMDSASENSAAFHYFVERYFAIYHKVKGTNESE